MTTDLLKKRKKKKRRIICQQWSNLNRLYPQDLRQFHSEITQWIQRERMKQIKLIESRTSKNRQWEIWLTLRTLIIRIDIILLSTSSLEVRAFFRWFTAKTSTSLRQWLPEIGSNSWQNSSTAIKSKLYNWFWITSHVILETQLLALKIAQTTLWLSIMDSPFLVTYSKRS